jgi:hypothetical protein
MRSVVRIKKWGWRKTAFRAPAIHSPERWLEPGGAASLKAAYAGIHALLRTAALPLITHCLLLNLSRSIHQTVVIRQFKGVPRPRHPTSSRPLPFLPESCEICAAPQNARPQFNFSYHDELRQLADAKIKGDYAKIQRAVIFACYAGFRVSALKTLTQEHK